MSPSSHELHSVAGVILSEAKDIYKVLAAEEMHRSFASLRMTVWKHRSRRGSIDDSVEA